MKTNAMASKDEMTVADEIQLEDGRRIHGTADDGYGSIMDVFVSNFLARDDVGAACTVYVDGQRVVDLWGGIADSRTGRAWEHDTAAVIFSCTKGVLAICAYQLVQDGRLDMPDDGARWGTGFQLSSPPSQPMLGPASFGHAGAGGQLPGQPDGRLRGRAGARADSGPPYRARRLT